MAFVRGIFAVAIVFAVCSAFCTGVNTSAGEDAPPEDGVRIAWSVAENVLLDYRIFNFGYDATSGKKTDIKMREHMFVFWYDVGEDGGEPRFEHHADDWKSIPLAFIFQLPETASAGAKRRIHEPVYRDP